MVNLVQLMQRWHLFPGSCVVSEERDERLQSLFIYWDILGIKLLHGVFIKKPVGPTNVVMFTTDP